MILPAPGYDPSPVRESKYQKQVRAEYEASGCVVLKMTPGPDVPKGFPDLLVLLPNGVTRLIEMKAADGTVSPSQQYWHDRLRAMGHDAMIVRGD